MARESPLERALWLPVNLVQGIYTALWTAGLTPFALVVAAVARSAGPALGMARWLWAPGLLIGARARLVVIGLERVDLTRPHLFVANHRSWIDIPALFRALPVELRFLAKQELARVPFLGLFMRSMGMVFVDRSDSRRARASVARAAGILGAGGSVVSFPEGTRSRDGRLGRFKTGGFGAAIEAGVDIVPIGIVGAGEVLPPGGFRVRPGRIEVRIGTPIPAPESAPQARAALARRAHDAVLALLAESAGTVTPQS